MKKIFKKIANIFSEIGVIDKLLLAIMCILISHILLSLFLNTNYGSVDGDIDIIVRTSIASIFGYFLSSNFMKNKDSQPVIESQPIIVGEPVLESEPFIISEPVVDSEPIIVSQPITYTNNDNDNNHAIVLGVFCLIILACVITYRIVNKDTSPPTVTISQLRDIISGCIGYLIGCPPVNDKH